VRSGLSRSSRSCALLLLLATACNTGRRALVESDAATPPTGPVRLLVVTFNVQDLFIADRRAERMRAIGRVLGPLRPDVIALQEAFSQSHREDLRASLEAAAGETYAMTYFHSGWMGSGLCVLSRHPIARAVFWRYSENGRWYQVKHGDWWAGKGVAAVRLAVGGGHLDLFDTHLIANYNDAQYHAERRIQVAELQRFIASEATVPAPALVLGDLNALTRHDEYQTLRAGDPALDDPIEEIAPELSGRIDHILARPHPGWIVEPLEVRKIFDGTGDDGRSLSLSDHPAYLLTLRIAPREPPGPDDPGGG
jgi:endonuclease/exonuclease/phosphatase family metal-dependent hydrolase